MLHLKQRLWAEQSNHVSLQNLLKRDKDNAQKSANEADARTLKVKEACEADLQRHLQMWKRVLEREEQAIQ